VINFIQNSAHLIQKAHGMYKAHGGVMNAPQSSYDMQKASSLGLQWVMDNNCFNAYEPSAILKLMAKNRGIKGCVFMTAPDVVQDHEATLLLFRAWLGTIQAYGFPVAFVLQNGVTIKSVPWDSIAAVFIGGDDSFKYSLQLALIVKEAKQRGKWVHMGRVNTIERINLCNRLKCDSFDGTCYSRFLNTYVPKHLPYYATNYCPPNQFKMELAA
jgi:hypothetical protein